MRTRLTYLFAAILFNIVQAYAQNIEFQHFRTNAGDYSAIYNGKIAVPYSKQRYANHPYWEVDYYRTGTLSYEGRVYSDVQLRYDLYLKEITLLTPEKKVGVIVDNRKVDYFLLNNVRFVPHEKEGFKLILHQGKKLLLTSEIQCKYGKNEVKETKSFTHFNIKETYTLTVDGVTYEVKSRNSLVKHFPTYKKQLKKYAKDNRLDFSARKRQALTALVNYTETLINAD